MGKDDISSQNGQKSKPRYGQGTMGKEKAAMGGLILEQEPSDKMAETAKRKDNLEYIWQKVFPSNHYSKLQILIVQEIIDGQLFDLPPAMMEIKKYRKEKTLF